MTGNEAEVIAAGCGYTVAYGLDDVRVVLETNDGT